MYILSITINIPCISVCKVGVAADERTPLLPTKEIPYPYIRGRARLYVAYQAHTYSGVAPKDPATPDALLVYNVTSRKERGGGRRAA